MMVFVCHVTLQDHMIKALSDFMIRSRLRYITILASLVAIDIVVVEIYLVYRLVCHVISQDHVIKE